MNYETIRNNFVLLTTRLSIDKLLKELRDKNLLQPYVFESLSKQSPVDQNIEFFLHIRTYGNDVLTYFFEWLKINDLHMFDRIEARRLSSNTLQVVRPAPMTREKYRRSRMILLDNVNPRVVASYMYEKGHMSNEQLEKIIGYPSRYKSRMECARELLYALDRHTGNPVFFTDFERVLAECQPFVYDAVMNEQSNLS